MCVLRDTASKLYKQDYPFLEKQSRYTAGSHLWKSLGRSILHRTRQGCCFVFAEGKSHQIIVLYIIKVTIFSFMGEIVVIPGSQRLLTAKGTEHWADILSALWLLVILDWVMKLLFSRWLSLPLLHWQIHQVAQDLSLTQSSC